METILLDDAFRRRVHDHVESFERQPIADGELVRAAVAFVLVGNDEGEAAFIITQRPFTLRRHAGQWALPGGRADEDETITETALREVEEELGLELDTEGVVGLLDDFQSRSGFIITPVVVLGPERPELHPSPAEVHAAHVVPLAALDTPGVPTIAASKPGERPLIYFPMPLLGTTIWAPTAAMLYQSREVLLHGRSTRVAHFEQPRWAWQ